MNKRILTIEDDEIQRTLIRKTLEKRNYTVLTAEDGEKGVSMAMSEKPDLIILDVLMSGLNGEEVCRRLKDDQSTKDIPILFLTAMGSPRDVITQYDLGGEIHLKKPINLKELLDQIQITLDDKIKHEG